MSGFHIANNRSRKTYIKKIKQVSLQLIKYYDMQKCQSILPLVQSDPHIKSKIPRFTESNMWNALFPRYSAPKGSLTSKQISFKCLAQVKYLKWFFGPLCKRSKKEPGGLLYLLSFSSLLLGECVYQDVFHCAWLLRSQRPKSMVLT